MNSRTRSARPTRTLGSTVKTPSGRRGDEAERPADKPADPPAFTKLLTGGELLALDLRPRFLVRGVLVEGQPMIIGGRSKTLKTSIACDLALSLGTGSPFLGKFDAHRTNVGFWSGESGAATLRETAKRQAESKGVDLAAASVLWCFDLPKLSQPDHLDHLAATIQRQRRVQVVVFDPLYLALLMRKRRDKPLTCSQWGRRCSR